MISDLAEVNTCEIGVRTKIWQFCVILAGAKIGSDCNICSHCYIEDGVIIGNSVTVKNGVRIYDGVTIEDHVFIGPNSTFTNDLYPISRNENFKKLNTIVQGGVSIGANVTILPGLTIGRGARIGAGAIITKDVPPMSLIKGKW